MPELNHSIKGNSSITVFKSNNSVIENKYGLQTKSEGNSSTVKGKQRKNRNSEVQKKKL